MVIRSAQAEVLSDTAGDQFENRVLAHLNRCFGEECSVMGEPAVREWIRYGIQRASEYQIRAERDVCKYIDLMIAFGRDFDRDAWAATVLKDRGLRDPTTRLETLYQAGKQQQRGRAGDVRFRER